MERKDIVAKRTRGPVRRSKTERIYRILLAVPHAKRTPYRIAVEADVSPSWVYRVLGRLSDQGVVHGTRVIDPDRLFDIWSGRRSMRLFREYHVKDPLSILKKAPGAYAATSYFAENLVGSYLFPRYYDVYIEPSDHMRWNGRLTAKGYVGRGNFRVLLDDPHVFWDGIDREGFHLVSPQQLIVDLLREGGECREAADLLMERYYGNL